MSVAGARPSFSEKWKDEIGATSDTSTNFVTATAPQARRSLADLPQEEALEAADKIDAVLRRRSDPVHERLKESLTATLRSRAKIARSLSDLDLPGTASGRGSRAGLAQPAGGPRAFGQQLAATWISFPDDRTPGVEGGRSRMLQQLDEVQAARVRGLLTHLEYAVQADPSVKVSDLVAVGDSSKAHWFDRPLPPPPPPPLQDVGEITIDKILSTPTEVDLFPREDDWPLYRIRREPRSKISGIKGVFEIKGKPAEKLMAFRERLREAHGSLAEAFQMMDIEGRGAISFDHFHAHLVRLKIGRTDAEGSIRTMDIFKLLDADGNDIVTPSDAIRSFAEAGKDVRELRAEAEAIRKYDENAAAHGFLEGRAHVRFDKRLKLTGDDLLQVATLRRWLEGNHGSFIAGLRAIDVDGQSFIRKEEFVCALVEGGYCHSAFEAMDLFRILDVHGYGSLSVEYLAKLESGEGLGAAHVEERTNPELDSNVRSGIGSGGLFSDPGRLDGPKPPPRLHLRTQLGSSQPVAPDQLYERLFTAQTQSYKKKLESKRRASEAPHVIMDQFLSHERNFLLHEGNSVPGSSKSSASRLAKSSAQSKGTTEDADAKRDDSESSGSFFARWGMFADEEETQALEQPAKPDEAAKPEEEADKPEEAAKPEEVAKAEEHSSVKAPKATAAMAERTKDVAEGTGVASVRRRAKLRSAARVGAAMLEVSNIARELKADDED